MSPRFRLSFKERHWTWEESPCQYYHTLEEADAAMWRGIRAGGRFKLFRIEEDTGAEDVLHEEIDVETLKDSP